jgi:hypothetical protein
MLLDFEVASRELPAADRELRAADRACSRFCRNITARETIY